MTDPRPRRIGLGLILALGLGLSLWGCAGREIRPVAEIKPFLEAQAQMRRQFTGLRAAGQVSLGLGGRAEQAFGLVLGSPQGRLRLDLLDPTGQTGLSLRIEGDLAEVLVPRERIVYSGPLAQAQGLMPQGLSAQDLVSILAGIVPRLDQAEVAGVEFDPASRTYLLTLAGPRPVLARVSADRKTLLSLEIRPERDGPAEGGSRTRAIPRVTYSDQRPVGSLNLPFLVHLEGGDGSELRLACQSLEISAVLPDRVFAWPAGVALARKPLSQLNR